MISLPLVNSVIVILVFTQCRPVQRLFDPASPGHCWNPQITTVYAQFGGAFSAMTDLGLVFFAVWIVGNLHMGWKVKVRLCCMLSLGIFAAGCAVAKTYYLSEHDNEAINDLTYGQTNLLIWTALDQYVIIIGANVPCVQPLVVSLFHKVKSTYSHDRNTHYPLDDMSVHHSQSPDGSSNAILGHHVGGGYEGDSIVSDQGASKNHPVFLDSGPGILKRVDVDIQFGGGSPGLRNTSRIV
ncbi:MAG: hypothetical protein ASARMPRED_002217 [Alectoria sarmentosa]|nr:MAG: hypothetical protein ASARMPRED_002217 [Alectoria sarmentosa]